MWSLPRIQGDASAGHSAVEIGFVNSSISGYRFYVELEFEWDPEKERRNIQKHGISFHEASGVFADPLSWIFRILRILLGSAVSLRSECPDRA